jgi:catechol 2,3-dioxygenase-like lactoylglutathione lyase family enzyme
MPTAAAPLVTKVNVVYLYVSDMERSVAFYRDLLGIALEGDEDWQEATLGGLRFALHHTHEGIGELSAGTVHLNFEVEDVDDAADRLRAAGIAAEESMRDEWGAALRVRDPDGYALYLFQPPVL